MDTERLLKVLNDLVTEDETNKVGTLLSSLAAYVTEGTAAAYESADESREELNDVLLASKLNEYTPSYQAILDTLGAADLVGAAAKRRIDTIFAGNPLQLATSLTTFSQKYQTQITNFKQTLTGLENLNFVAYDSEDYEVGFLIPSELDNLQDIASHLKYLDRFLVICAQIAGEQDTVTHLARVSTGSFSFFSASGIASAKVVATILKHVVKFTQAVAQVKKANAEIEKIGAEATEHKTAAFKNLVDAQKTLSDTYVQEAVSDVMDNHFSGNEDLRHVLANDLGVTMRLILLDIQKGIKVEVAPPTAYVQADSQPADDKATQKHIQELAVVNRNLKQLYSNPEVLKQLPKDNPITATELTQLMKPKKAPRKKSPQPKSKTAKKTTKATKKDVTTDAKKALDK